MSDIAHVVKMATSHISYNQQQVSDIAQFVKVSHHIFHDYQFVSDIAHVKGSLIIFFCDQQNVSDIAHFAKGSLITSFP